MERNKEIEKVVKTFKKHILALWLIAIFIVLIGEFAINDATGCFADNGMARYLSETIIILLTAICVPLSVKLLSWKLKNIIYPITEKSIHIYERWGIVRYYILLPPIILGISCYYLMQSSTGLLCTAICLLASLYSFPDAKGIINDFETDKSE